MGEKEHAALFNLVGGGGGTMYGVGVRGSCHLVHVGSPHQAASDMQNDGKRTGSEDKEGSEMGLHQLKLFLRLELFLCIHAKITPKIRQPRGRVRAVKIARRLQPTSL
jgi:hypothetical protein